jgi:proteic killer suppression protein
MIKSFGDKATSDLFDGINSSKMRKLPNQIFEPAIRKLDALNAAVALNDLKFPPGNRLKSLHGDLKDFYSIRINAQWRIIFQWKDSYAYEVAIVDYHS